MCRSAQSYPGNNLGKLLKKFWLFFAGLSVAQVCIADSSSPPSWTKGPAHISLGDYARIELPAGYKFADGQAAASLLKIGSSGSGKLLGVVVPTSSDFSPRQVSGDWYIAFEYFDIGHVNDLREPVINDEEVFTNLHSRVITINQERDRRGQPALANVDWQIKPIYKVDARSIEWALRGDGVSGVDTVVDYVNRNLTRRGVLQARATVYKGGTVVTAWIQDLVGALKIKSGEKYEDFQASDKTASVGLATVAREIPSNANIAAKAAPAPSTAAVDNVGGMKIFWIVVGVLGCVGIVGGGLLARRFRQYRVSHETQPAEALPGEEAVVAVSGNGNGHGHKNGLKLNGHGFKSARPQKSARARSSNGNGANGNGNGKDVKRKRMFNYHKFYTEMVLQGPSPVVADNYSAYELDPYTAAYMNGYAVSNGNGRPHGNGNGHSNGNGNGHTNGNGNGSGNGAESNGAASAMLTAAHNDLIATQRGLIEEQKRLIQEQARLIEEKTKLLVEKDRLIERQAQIFGNQPS